MRDAWLHVRVSPVLRARLIDLAEEHRISVSAAIRRGLASLAFGDSREWLPPARRPSLDRKRRR